jgi:hypothetical protein
MSSDPKPVLLALEQVRTDGGTQARVTLDDATVDEYVEVLVQLGTGAAPGQLFPPVVVFFDGTDYWLADGFHRKAAHKKAGRKQILCEVRQGTKRDAILYAVGANARHGLRRTNEDKRIAVRRLLTDDEWSQWSDREIARRCGVGHPLVAELRAELSGSSSRCAQPERTVQRGKTLFTMNTAGIGKPAAAPGPDVVVEPDPLPPSPPAEDASAATAVVESRQPGPAAGREDAMWETLKKLDRRLYDLCLEATRSMQAPADGWSDAISRILGQLEATVDSLYDQGYRPDFS